MAIINGTPEDNSLTGTVSADSIFGFAGNDTLYGVEGNDTLDGGYGIDIIYGGLGDDSVSGGGGEDALYGDNGIDTLVGGLGDDSMEGGLGADTYILSKAAGQDRIANYDSDSSVDVATFTDVASSDVSTVSRYGNDLVLQYGTSGGQLTVENYFYGDNAAYRVDTFDFTNVDWTVSDIKSLVVTKGTEIGETIYGYNSGANRIFAYGGDDNVSGGDGNDALDGGTGNDNLRGYDGNDSLLGLSGEDSLQGDNGNDTLDGGSGDDYLEGNQGADLYLLSKAGGQDYIVNYDSDNSVDVARFADVATTDVTEVSRYGNDLVLRYGVLGGELRVENYFYSDNTAYRVDTFDFTNIDWAAADIKALVITQGTESAETISGYNGGGNRVFAYGGDDNVYGGDANDNLDGGGGNDYLRGYDGNDTLLGQSGADKLYGDNGSDTLIGGGGDDYQEGNQGADTYVLSEAGGQDRISNYDSDNSVDVAQFTDVVSGEISEVSRYGNDLVLKYGAADGQLTVENYFYSDNAAYRIDTFDFTDVDWTVVDIKSRVLTKGTEAGETIYGYNGGGNRVFALGGRDNVYGGDNQDSLDGGAGNDYLRGNDGNDTLLGQSGADKLYGDNGNDTLIGGAGNDYQEGNQGADTYMLSKAGGQDRISNYDSDSSVDVARFSDVATTDVSEVSRYGNDLILKYGTLGGQLTVDNYFYGDNATYRIDTFDFTNADWTVTQIKSLAITKGSELAESMTGYNSGANRVFAYGGNDTVYGGDGNDNVDGGAGNDYLRGNDGDDTLLGQSGADKIYGDNGSDTLNGGSGDDYLEGNQGADTYVIGKADGHDVINNYDSDSSVDKVQFSDVTLCDLTNAARVGNDLVLSYGSASQLTVKYHFSAAVYEMGQFLFADGATIDDVVMGTAVGEALTGSGATNDLIVGAGGVDTMSGLLGNDVYLTDGGDSIVEAAAGGTDTVLSSVTYTLGTNLEQLVLLAGAVNGTGNTVANLLCGNTAANTLTGLGGNDTLNGAAGADTMVGGIGDDTYVRDNVLDVVSELAGQGNDTVQSTLALSLAAVGWTEVENVTLLGSAAINATGNDLANTLTGNGGNNVLDGGLGADTMIGGLGNDTYLRDNAGDVVTEAASQGTDTVQSSVSYTLALNVENLTLLTGAVNGGGNTLANTLIGNAVANTLDGSSGNDRLLGKDGNDVLIGGIGADRFQFDTALNAVSNVDQINDFVSVDDTLVLENAIFSKFTSVGAIQAGNLVIGNAALDGDDYLLYDSSNGHLSYDADGNGLGAAVHFATLVGMPSVTVADFSII